MKVIYMFIIIFVDKTIKFIEFDLDDPTQAGLTTELSNKTNMGTTIDH